MSILPLRPWFAPTVALGLALVQVSSLRAQPVAGKVQPDGLDFGHVCVGSTVEGSLRVFAKGDTAEGVDVDVQAPGFADVIDQKLGTQAYGSYGTMIVFDVMLSVNTAAAGVRSGEVRVTVGSQEVHVPVGAIVLAPNPNAPRVLVVETPFDRFSTADGTSFIPWLNLVDEAGLNVDYWLVEEDEPVLRHAELTTFDVILLACTGLTKLQEVDLVRLKDYVENGGRVIVCANYCFRGTVDAANGILAWGGLRMTDVELRDDAAFARRLVNAERRGSNLIPAIRLAGDAVSDHPLTKGVSIVRVQRPSPIAVTDRVNGTILVAAPQYPDQGYVAVGQFGRGEIVALGQSLWWNWISHSMFDGSDNRQLLRNVLDRR